MFLYQKKKPTHNSEQQLSSSWVAEGAQQHSVVHWQEKKGRETSDEVMRVFYADLLRQSAELLMVSISSWWSLSVPGYTEVICGTFAVPNCFNYDLDIIYSFAVIWISS